MMAYLHIFVLAALSATILAKPCNDDSDCGDVSCNHGLYAVCKVQHGSGVGAGEKACECVHHKRLVLGGSDTQVCKSVSDCTAWGQTNCQHGKLGCEISHGTGVGGGEYNCVCKSHKRAAGCCTASDCDATALGCDAHHEVASCELAHGSGQGCGENTCKCVPKHG